MSVDRSRVRTARATGLFYLALGLCAMPGLVLIRPTLFVPDDAAATLARLLANEAMARLGIALELATVIAQSLAALWFYRLFRPIDDFAAAAIAVFGLFNAVAILASSAMLATALQVALDPTLVGGANAQLMYLVSNNLWQSGNVFFGLWLIPMGWCVLRSGWMPAALGWLLIVGGIGYLVMPFIAVLVPEAGTAIAVLPVLATVGEFWMIGYLLLYGVKLKVSRGDGRRSRSLAQ